MFAPAYFGERHFSPRYFGPGVDVVIPTPPRGGGGTSSAPGTKYNQAPDTRETRRSYLAQARQEDEDLIYLLQAFAEVIKWH